MPVSKHRRPGKTSRGKTSQGRSDQAPDGSRPAATTIGELRRTVANPALDFPAKIVVAGLWWFEQLLRRVGDQWQSVKASRKDKRTAAMLLCVAMDGEHGQNDDLSPVLADMLRPYCPTASFVDAWEQAKHLSPGTVRTMVAKILTQTGKPAA
jgi:hypothetical protein